MGESAELNSAQQEAEAHLDQSKQTIHELQAALKNAQVRLRPALYLFTAQAEQTAFRQRSPSSSNLKLLSMHFCSVLPWAELASALHKAFWPIVV